MVMPNSAMARLATGGSYSRLPLLISHARLASFGTSGKVDFDWPPETTNVFS